MWKLPLVSQWHFLRIISHAILMHNNTIKYLIVPGGINYFISQMNITFEKCCEYSTIHSLIYSKYYVYLPKSWISHHGLILICDAMIGHWSTVCDLCRLQMTDVSLFNFKSKRMLCSLYALPVFLIKVVLAHVEGVTLWFELTLCKYWND